MKKIIYIYRTKKIVRSGCSDFLRKVLTLNQNRNNFARIIFLDIYELRWSDDNKKI